MKNPDINYSRVKPLVEYLQKQRENEKFYRSLELAATFLLIIFFLFFAIKPTVFTISSLIGDIKSKETLSKNLRQKIGQIVEAQDVFSQVQERYLVIDSALPDNPNFTHLATQILQSSRDASIPVSRIDYQLDTKTGSKDESSLLSPQIKTYSVGTNIDTAYPQIIDLLNKLDNNRRLITVKQVILNSADRNLKEATPSGGSLSATINAQVYYWPVQE